jgi:hypothetical protein
MHDTEGETIEDVRRQRDEIGIQLAALRERLRLAMAVVDACKSPIYDRDARIKAALAAFDEVPGDTLERP